MCVFPNFSLAAWQINISGMGRDYFKHSLYIFSVCFPRPFSDSGKLIFREWNYWRIIFGCRWKKDVAYIRTNEWISLVQIYITVWSSEQLWGPTEEQWEPHRTAEQIVPLVEGLLARATVQTIVWTHFRQVDWEGSDVSEFHILECKMAYKITRR